MPRATTSYNKKVTFDRGFGAKTVLDTKPSDSSQNWRPANEVSSEHIKNKSSQPSVLCGSFMQIIVNLMQLQDHEFMAWLDRLVEARRNRQEKRKHPYRTYCRPYNGDKQLGERWNKPQIRHKIKSAQELEVQQIMDNFNCQYNNVVETVDLYNLDVN